MIFIKKKKKKNTDLPRVAGSIKFLILYLRNFAILYDYNLVNEGASAIHSGLVVA